MSSPDEVTSLTGPERATVATVPVRMRQGSSSDLDELDQHPEWTTLSRLPLRVRVEIPLPRFKVRDLLVLQCGALVQSEWSSTADVPLIVASAQLSWAEFEVVEQRMAVRLTRLA